MQIAIAAWLANGRTIYMYHSYISSGSINSLSACCADFIYDSIDSIHGDIFSWVFLQKIRKT